MDRPLACLTFCWTSCRGFRIAPFLVVGIYQLWWQPPVRFGEHHQTTVCSSFHVSYNALSFSEIHANRHFTNMPFPDVMTAAPNLIIRKSVPTCYLHLQKTKTVNWILPPNFSPLSQQMQLLTQLNCGMDLPFPSPFSFCSAYTVGPGWVRVDCNGNFSFSLPLCSY